MARGAFLLICVKILPAWAHEKGAMTTVPSLLIAALLSAGACVFAQPPAPPVLAGKPNPDYSRAGHLDLSRLPADAQGRRIVARVNGRPLFEERFLVELRRAAASAGGDPRRVEAMHSALAEPVLEQLVRVALVEEYAQKHELRVAESEISQALKAANDELPPGRKLQDQAISRGEPPEMLRQEIRERLLQKKVRDHLGRAVLPADPAREAQLLEQTKSALVGLKATSATEVRARHIVIRSPSDASTTETQQARKAAERVLEKIREGMDFGQAARLYSQDRLSRELDGDLGFFSRGRMYPEFDEAAFALQPGEVSGLVQTPVGFHIIQVTDRREAGVQARYQEQERLRLFDEWLARAYREAKVERYF